ncbi:hypothetical protein JW948_07075 [bacterium]|nr:hypothetical protein [bacterium]
MLKSRFILIFLLSGLLFGRSNPILQEADSLYALRAFGFQPETGLVDSIMIDRAIRAYEKAVNASDSSEKPPVIWKLMQCFYYKGNFTTADKEIKKQLFLEGIRIGERALKTYPDSPGLHFWMGILWGYWSEQVGLLTAGRKGVAGKVRHHAETLIGIQDDFAEGGGYRTLGRLHDQAPKIPLILGWPSKEKSIAYFEKAYAIKPDNLFTKQYYAEALYDQGQKERAVQMMREIIALDSTVHGIAEDAFIKREARHFLEEHAESL